MSSSPFQRGAVVKGPNPFGQASARPYVKLSDDTHPFDREEGLFVAITTTQRTEAIPLPANEFVSGGLPKRSYASPWVITTFKYADLQGREGVLKQDVTEEVAEAASGYLGVGP